MAIRPSALHDTEKPPDSPGCEYNSTELATIAVENSMVIGELNGTLSAPIEGVVLTMKGGSRGAVRKVQISAVATLFPKLSLAEESIATE